MATSQALAAAIELLLADAHLRQAMGRRGRAKVEARYTWDHIYRILLDTYQGLAPGPHPERVRQREPGSWPSGEGRALTVRVLHVVHQYLPDHVGGTEHYVRTLAVAQQQAGHQVAIFLPAERKRSEVDPGRPPRRDHPLPGHRRAFSPARRFRSTLGDRFLDGCLAQAIGETQPDLIHIHHLMGLPTGALVAAGHSIPLARHPARLLVGLCQRPAPHQL